MRSRLRSRSASGIAITGPTAAISAAPAPGHCFQRGLRATRAHAHHSSCGSAERQVRLGLVTR
jgi:hypothetical protein